MAIAEDPPVDDSAQSLLGPSYAQTRLEAAKLEAALFAYYMGRGPRPKGEGGPEPFLDLQSFAIGNAIIGMLGTVGYIGGDQEGAPPVTGPGGPVMRDILIGLTVVQLASHLSDHELGRRLEASAADLVVHQAQRMRENIS